MPPATTVSSVPPVKKAQFQGPNGSATAFKASRPVEKVVFPNSSNGKNHGKSLTAQRVASKHGGWNPKIPGANSEITGTIWEFGFEFWILDRWIWGFWIGESGDFVVTLPFKLTKGCFPFTIQAPQSASNHTEFIQIQFASSFLYMIHDISFSHFPTPSVITLHVCQDSKMVPLFAEAAAPSPWVAGGSCTFTTFGSDFLASRSCRS